MGTLTLKSFGDAYVSGDTQVPELVARGADLSSDGRYRYGLSRVWDDAATCMLFIMLNPSTADHTVDDPTIRRCMGFARRERYGGIAVVNLFAYRATKPADLYEAFDPAGPGNDVMLDRCIRDQASVGGRIVCAWGAHPLATTAGDVLVTRHRLEGIDFHCLGKTQDGYPRHPLYLPSGQPLESYP